MMATATRPTTAAQDIREHPLIFGARSVRDLLADRKTQTRRVITRENSLVDGHRARVCFWEGLDFSAAWIDNGPSSAGNDGPYLKVKHTSGTVHSVYPKVQAGDRIWVRETWCPFRPEDIYRGQRWAYAADDMSDDSERCRKELGYKWHTSMFMPREASRITLDVLASRPERLQGISEVDCEAELGELPHTLGDSAYTVFRNHWDSINAARGFPFVSDPWVWVYETRRLLTRKGCAE